MCVHDDDLDEEERKLDVSFYGGEVNPKSVAEAAKELKNFEKSARQSGIDLTNPGLAFYPDQTSYI